MVIARWPPAARRPILDEKAVTASASEAVQTVLDRRVAALLAMTAFSCEERGEALPALLLRLQKSLINI
jgi:hypothetical protein